MVEPPVELKQKIDEADIAKDVDVAPDITQAIVVAPRIAQPNVVEPSIDRPFLSISRFIQLILFFSICNHIDGFRNLEYKSLRFQKQGYERY
ncbi:hypothetical protein QL285_085028 [Trifolium repens]|nr:hypothetical protein QL285_085028 [Trifolium repens]